MRLARENQVGELVLTDINSTSACLNFIRKAPEYGVRPIVGIDFRNGADPCFVGIAKNNEGFQELNAFLSTHLHQDKELPQRAPNFKDAFVVYPFEKALRNEFYEYGPHEFVGVCINDLRRLPFSRLKDLKDKLVVLQTVTFRNKRDFNAHRLLRAIANNVLLSKLQLNEQADPNEKMLPMQELTAAFATYPWILRTTERLLGQCSISFDFSKNRSPQNLRYYSNSKEEDESLLEQLCQEGMRYRYPNATTKVWARLRKEQDLDKKNGLCLLFFDQLGHCFRSS